MMKGNWMTMKKKSFDLVKDFISGDNETDSIAAGILFNL